MVDSISSLGIQTVNANNLTRGQSLLSRLSEQLTTGKYSTQLADYTSSSAQKLLNFNSSINQQEGFLNVIDTLSPRIKVYDSTLSSIEDTAAEAYTLFLSSTTYNDTTNSALQSQIQGYMDQMNYFLNQQVGDRYIYAGSRYDQAPVVDIKTLPVPPTETAPYLATGNAVPAYDADYDPLNPATAIPAAYTEDSVLIDKGNKLTYGITSNDAGFQQIVMGLRFAYAATQDQANYDTYMTTARDLISTGLANTRATHTDLTNAYNSLNKAKELIEGNISNLKTQVDDIQNVDVNEVAVKITILQAQLEASYAATGKIANLSIIDYL